MLELNTILQSDLLAEERRMLQLAGTAVLDVFDTAMRSRREANNAGLGPEDLRFLEALNGLAGPNAEKEIQPQPEIES